jgi:hypothetical protein
LQLMGRSFLGGHNRSRQRRRATVSPFRASSMAFLVSFSASSSRSSCRIGLS